MCAPHAALSPFSLRENARMMGGVAAIFPLPRPFPDGEGEERNTRFNDLVCNSGLPRVIFPFATVVYGS